MTASGSRYPRDGGWGGKRTVAIVVVASKPLGESTEGLVAISAGFPQLRGPWPSQSGH